MSQQTFGGHDDQWFAPEANSLASQAMEILCRSRWINDLHVVFGRKMEKSFQARAGMLGTLAFETMRQKQYETAEAFPFIFGACDELVDNRLSSVPEVAELRFP